MNEYIGLQYKWGANPDTEEGFTDCFQLCCAIRRKLGLRDYGPRFAWVYDKYDEDSFSARLLLRWFKQNSIQVDSVIDGDVGINSQGAALMTVANNRIYCIAQRGKSVSIECNEGVLSYAHWLRLK